MLFACRQTDTRHQTDNRRAATLIEWLTVAAILGGLAMLVASLAIHSSVLGPRGRAKSAHTLELKQFDMALHAYKDRFGEFPPDGLETSNRTRQELFEDHVMKARPDCSREALAYGWISYGQHLTPASALVFWLGGLADKTGARIGFSANPANPFDRETTSRIGPFFVGFDANRLACDPNHEGVCCYYPTMAARQTGSPNWAIRYYRAEDGTYAGKGAIPFRDSQKSGLAAGDDLWINPHTFQIVSPGLTGGPFVEEGPNPQFPSGPYTKAQGQMMANFTTGTMEDAMP